MEPQGLTTEQLFEQMQKDERNDKLAEQTLAPVIEYARSRGVVPQKIYYLIRTHRIQKEICPCGRSCVNIAEADKVLHELEDAKKEVKNIDGS